MQHMLPHNFTLLLKNCSYVYILVGFSEITKKTWNLDVNDYFEIPW